MFIVDRFATEKYATHIPATSFNECFVWRNKMIDMTGEVYNKLKVIKFDHYDKKHNSYWLCSCECGNKTVVRRAHLLSGNIKSCGCFLKSPDRKRIITHGLWKENKRLCKIWDCMKDRCYNPTRKAYKNYGGRGIIVCDEWKNSFLSFIEWAKNNGYRSDLTIDRIDVNGNYEPSNCRWATMKEQCRNKRNTRHITYNGETHTVPEWNEIRGDRLIERRLEKGWSIKDAFEVPKGMFRKIFLERRNII
jgi:hypothetical protein